MSRTGGAVAFVGRNRTPLWLGAILFFVVGDIVTTTVGLGLEPIVELGPLVAPLIEQYGLAAMVVLKTALFGACYCLYRCVPRPHDVGVPLGLALLGVLVTGWNLALLTLVL